jgi:hypothetical protein
MLTDLSRFAMLIALTVAALYWMGADIAHAWLMPY